MFVQVTAGQMGAEEFDYAKDRVWDLPRLPDNNELLELYKLYSFWLTTAQFQVQARNTR